jgi:flagellar basal body-associated protein FliL
MFTNTRLQTVVDTPFIGRLLFVLFMIICTLLALVLIVSRAWMVKRRAPAQVHMSQTIVRKMKIN